MVAQVLQGREGNDEREQTLNQLLVEMDGFGTSENIVVFAATNRFDMLDKALVRPGRFDRNIELTLPDLDARKEIFMVHLRNLKLNEISSMEEFARRLATLTPGFSGSDIATICNEAAIYAVRRKDTSIDSTHFEEAVERLIGGVRTTKSISQEEERTVAYHESGHGVVGWFLKGAMPLLKLTIIPRTKGALGFAQYLPKEDQTATKEEFMDIICSILAGRCTEQFFFGKVTTGAYDDLNKVYDLARRMVTQYGMSDKLGLIAYEEKPRSGTRVFSDKMNEVAEF